MLSRATPLFPIEAIRDTPAEAEAEPEPDVVSSAPDRRTSRAERASDTAPPADAQRETAADAQRETASDRRGMIAPKLPVPGRAPPSRAMLLVVGFGGLALAAGAVYVFYQGRSAVLGRDAATDAAFFDAPIADAPIVDVHGARDAAVLAPDATPLAPDAAPFAPDAGILLAHPDASTRPPVDATLAPRDATAADAGLATLTIGADPWGDISIDGKPYGHTPRKIQVAAGHHTVEIVFPAESPPRKQTFAVDVSAGETKPIQADFH